MTSVSTAQPGWVYFIGAGPGDPGLLTLRGAELLGLATIVLYDRLVDEEIMSFVSPNAELVDVGTEATAGG
jgi:siroheme synthase